MFVYTMCIYIFAYRYVLTVPNVVSGKETCRRTVQWILFLAVSITLKREWLSTWYMHMRCYTSGNFLHTFVLIAEVHRVCILTRALVKLYLYQIFVGRRATSSGKTGLNLVSVRMQCLVTFSSSFREKLPVLL